MIVRHYHDTVWSTVEMCKAAGRAGWCFFMDWGTVVRSASAQAPWRRKLTWLINNCSKCSCCTLCWKWEEPCHKQIQSVRGRGNDIPQSSREKQREVWPGLGGVKRRCQNRFFILGPICGSKCGDEVRKKEKKESWAIKKEMCLEPNNNWVNERGRITRVCRTILKIANSSNK